ncbi:EndoU domain-containing protein [Glycomyces dulcitolivorans]|uniref:EndoU domain-containing protein n=1 Tax=Glycomyces dulcitolivorans TaxID=2200759 RepID=UPI000DD2F95D|nr:EndoU domain-containing protein [Glycomyces dulcitolivorans]
MPSIDTLITALRTNIDQVRDLITGIAATREQATAVRDQIGALGIQNSAAQAATTVDKLEEGQAQAAALSDKLEAALAAAEAARTGAGGKSSSGSGPSGPPPTAPEPPIHADYPRDLPHPISWSDLRHVCHGDEDDIEKGGHLSGTGRPNKREFPPGWGEEDVREALESVAARPESAQPREGRWWVKGTHRGITIRVVVRSDGSIDAGWPISGPGVIMNPRRRY